MIFKKLKNMLGIHTKSDTTPPPPVRADDLFSDVGAPEYTGDPESRSSSSVVIAPRAADADLARLEAPLAASSTPEANAVIVDQRPRKAPQPARDDKGAGWDSLSFGD